MQTNNDEPQNDTTDPAPGNKKQQEQSDPQLTELKGFVDPDEDLEPTLEDGRKSPDKAGDEQTKTESKD